MKIRDGWESYLAEVVPRSAGENQIRETRQAFYGGAGIALAAISAIADESISEDEAARIIGELMQEVNDFAASLRGHH